TVFAYIYSLSLHDALPILYAIFFQGGVENVLLQKLLKICDLLGASRYNIPRREEMISNMTDLHNEIGEKKNFLREVEGSIKKFRSEEHTSELQSRENLVCR